MYYLTYGSDNILIDLNNLCSENHALLRRWSQESFMAFTKKLNKKIDPLRNNRILLHIYHFFCQLIIKVRLIAKKEYSSQECKLTNKFDIDKKIYFTFKIKCFNTKAFYLEYQVSRTE